MMLSLLRQLCVYVAVAEDVVFKGNDIVVGFCHVVVIVRAALVFRCC